MKIIDWDGRPISKPGFYRSVPLAQYHSGRLCTGPSLTSSAQRRLILKSPAHYWDESPLNPNRNPDADKESEELVLGRAAHHLFAREAKFSETFALRPELAPDAKGVIGPWNGNKTACRDWIAAQKVAGRSVITADQLGRIKGMASAVSRHPFVRQGALTGEVEITIAWQDKAGLWLLARPDVIPTQSADIVDLKSTSKGISYLDVQYVIGEYGYYMQGAHIAEGYRAIEGQDAASVSFFFVESKRPHCCHLWRMEDEDLARGEKLNAIARKRFIRAMNTGEWAGPEGEQTRETRVGLSRRERERIDYILEREQ